MLGPVQQEYAYAELKLLIPNLRDNVLVSTLKSVEILGKKYMPLTIIITQIVEDGPKFGVIKAIFCIVIDGTSNIYYQLHECNTLYFDSYYHAYKIDSYFFKV